MSVSPSVCLFSEERNHPSFVKNSPAVVIDASIKRSSRVLIHENPKIWFYSQKMSKLNFDLCRSAWNHLSFVNISPTFVIDTSMERSSQVLQHGYPKIFFSKKVEIEFWLVFYFWRRALITLASSMSVLN